MQVFSRSKGLLRKIAKKCKVSGRRASACGYAKGLLEAEQKVQALVARTPNSAKKRKHPVVVVAGAFDAAKGRGTAAFNGIGKSTAAMKKRFRAVGLTFGQENACGTGNTVGNCAEFRAAHILLKSGSKLKNIFWTQAYKVTKGPGGRIRIQKAVGPCNICQITLGL